MASPFFFVNKKSGDLRPCQDYQELNDATIKNAYPLTLVGDLLDKLKGATIFTKLDICWRHHNIRIKKGDKWKAAFKFQNTKRILQTIGNVLWAYQQPRHLPNHDE